MKPPFFTAFFPANEHFAGKDRPANAHFSMIWLFLVFALFLPRFGHAEIPEDYKPIFIKAPFSFSERVFDLSQAVSRARAEQKNLFIYMGAKDCPPCQMYTKFLGDHVAELRSSFENVVVVDIFTWLNSSTPVIFKVDDKRYTFDEWKTRIGDPNAVLAYPKFWLLSPELALVRPLPYSAYTNLKPLIQLLKLKPPKSTVTEPREKPA